MSLEGQRENWDITNSLRWSGSGSQFVWYSWRMGAEWTVADGPWFGRLASTSARIYWVPVRPRPFQFTANTAFYAAIVAAIGLGLPRWWKATHPPGLCTKCKYDLKDLPICPECGTPVPRSSQATVPNAPPATEPAA